MCVSLGGCRCKERDRAPKKKNEGEEGYGGEENERGNIGWGRKTTETVIEESEGRK